MPFIPINMQFSMEEGKLSDLYSHMYEFQHIVLNHESSSVRPNLVYFPACEDVQGCPQMWENISHVQIQH